MAIIWRSASPAGNQVRITTLEQRFAVLILIVVLQLDAEFGEQRLVLFFPANRNKSETLKKLRLS
jgi:hypothetical protein